jgi:hypothetical protein
MDALIYTFKTNPIILLKNFTPLIIFVIILIPFNIFLMPIIYKKIYNADKSLQQYRKIKITDEFISITTETENINLRKTNINKIEYDKDSIYIFVGLKVHIIKKDSLKMILGK